MRSVCVYYVHLEARDNEFNSGPNQEIINKITLWNTMLRRPSRRRFRCVVLLCYTFPAKIIIYMVYTNAVRRVYYTCTAFRIDNLSAFKSLHFWWVLFSPVIIMIIIINVWRDDITLFIFVLVRTMNTTVKTII